MKIVAMIARYLLGLEFLVFGLNGFLHFLQMQPMAGPGAQFMGAIYGTGYLHVIFLLELIPAILLLLGRYVPLALTLLGPIIVNILLFHIFLVPGAVPIGIALFTALLWGLVFYSRREAFAGIFAA